jgi:hypothetical protein
MTDSLGDDGVGGVGEAGVVLEVAGTQFGSFPPALAFVPA